MSNENEDKDAIIRQQQLIIEDQMRILAKQHLALAHYKDFYWHAERKPWGYFFWLVFRHVWPFSGLWRKQ